MLTLVTEQPLLLSLMLGVLAGGLIYGWLQNGKKEAAVAGLVITLLIPVVWVIASTVETDREQIEKLIYEIADAVEKNDHERALQIIGDPSTRAQAKAELQRWEFQLARVNKMRSIDVPDGAIPPEAHVDMSVKVDVSQRRGGMRNVRVARRLLLTFQKVDEKWVVTDYQHLPMTGGPDRFSNAPTSVPSR